MFPTDLILKAKKELQKTHMFGGKAIQQNAI